MKGAFQISREIFDNEVWTDIVKFRLFFYILGNAVFAKDGIDHAGIHLERGQYLRSMRNLQQDLSYKEGRGNAIKSYPLTTIQRKIKSLVNEERITVKSTEYGTLFTVSNYAEYQGFERYNKEPVEQLRNSYGTATEQLRNNNKNDKNDKNDKKEIHCVFDHYNSKEIIKHKTLNSPMKTAINARLKDYTYEQLIQAIDNYTIAFKSNDYWFSQRYALADLMRDKDIRKFIDEADPLTNFKVNHSKFTKKKGSEEGDYNLE